MVAAYTMPTDIKPSTTWLKILKPWYAVMGEASADGPLEDELDGRFEHELMMRKSASTVRAAAHTGHAAAFRSGAAGLTHRAAPSSP